MAKRKKKDEVWVNIDPENWKKIVKPRLDNPKDGDRWVPWDVPEKVNHLVEERTMKMEEWILNGLQDGDTRSIRTGVLKCVLPNCSDYGKVISNKIFKIKKLLDCSNEHK